MCGIIGALALDKQTPVNRLVIERYQDQRSRGTEGFGISYLDNDKMETARSTTELQFSLDLSLIKSPFILAHHRRPTSSDNLTSQTHPIRIISPLLKYRYLIAHNGVILNDKELKEKHETLGFSYSTDITSTIKDQFNDSEALAIEIAMFIEQMKSKVETRGYVAFVGIQMDQDNHPLQLFYGRNGNPLKIIRNQHNLILASEGKGDDVESDLIHFIDLNNPNFKHSAQPCKIDTGYTETSTYYHSYDDDDYARSLWPTGRTIEINEPSKTKADMKDMAEEEGLREYYETQLSYAVDTFLEAVCDPNQLDDVPGHIAAINTELQDITENARTYWTQATAIEEERIKREETLAGQTNPT